MTYVDGFIIAVPTARIDDYKAVAEKAGAIWKEYGAIAYVECVADDVPHGELTSFPRAVHKKDDETVVFSWITYESREARDAINKKVMDDARLWHDANDMVFDGKRLIHGGFTTLVEM